jgi:signal peptidase II
MVQSMVKQEEPVETSQQKRKLALPDLKAHLIFWPLAIGGFALDLWSKSAVFDWLDTLDSYSVIDGFIQFITAQNKGAAWSMFYGRTVLLVAVAILALAAIILFFLFSGRQPRIVHIAMGFFAAGVSGNLYDRCFNNGQVRDFIDVSYRGYHWPTFNVADSLLVIGVGLLIISTFITGKPARKHGQPQK